MPEVVSVMICEGGKHRNKLARVLLSDGTVLYREFGSTTPNWRIENFLIPAVINRDDEMRNKSRGQKKLYG